MYFLRAEKLNFATDHGAMKFEGSAGIFQGSEPTAAYFRLDAVWPSEIRAEISVEHTDTSDAGRRPKPAYL